MENRFFSNLSQSRKLRLILLLACLTASREAKVVLIATQKRDDKVMISPARNPKQNLLMVVNFYGSQVNVQNIP